MYKTKKILFLDAVTTGYNPDRHCIYRLGGIFTENGQETGRFELKMQPPKDALIAEDALRVTGETRSGLMKYPQQDEAFGLFLNILDGKVNQYDMDDKLYIGGFTASMVEFPFVKKWFVRNGNRNFRNYFCYQTIDVSTLAAFALMDEPVGGKGFQLWNVAERLGIDPTVSGEFSCLDDCRTSSEIYRKLRVRFHMEEGADAPVFNEVIKNF